MWDERVCASESVASVYKRIFARLSWNLDHPSTLHYNHIIASCFVCPILHQCLLFTYHMKVIVFIKRFFDWKKAFRTLPICRVEIISKYQYLVIILVRRNMDPLRIIAFILKTINILWMKSKCLQGSFREQYNILSLYLILVSLCVYTWKRNLMKWKFK